jgi:mRNA-degrading endonuclease RelE of RelBE toxin-antitoxin system
LAHAPKFRISQSQKAIAETKAVPKYLQKAITEAVRQLSYEGCKAAGYALSGPPPWSNLCAVHVQGWRIITAFPAPDEVLLVKVAPHDTSTDPYADLAEQLGIEIYTGERLKPSCCEAANAPPMSSEELALVLAAGTRLSPQES